MVDLEMSQRLASDLVRALRGARSQRALCRRLGLTSNAVYAWESRRRFPVASLFFRLLECTGRKVEHPLLAALTLPADALEGADIASREGVARLLRALARDRSTSELARAVAVDRTTATRWLAGRSEPRLPELLRLIDATSQRLVDVLSLFVDPASLPSIAARVRVLHAQRKLAYELPMSHAVLRALELQPPLGAHATAAFIADRIGLPEDEIEPLLQALEAAGVIAQRAGGWTIQRVMTVDTRADPAANLELKRHWAQVGLQRLRRLQGDGPQSSGFFSYNLFAISDRGYARARELHAEYYERLRELIESDREPRRVVLTNLQLLPLDE